jgi:hypothetical protein
MCTVGVPHDAVLDTENEFVGWRSYNLLHTDDVPPILKLKGAYGQEWDAATLEAVCMKNRRDPTLYPPEHEAPKANCNCGIYAVTEEPGIWNFLSAQGITAKVSARNFLRGDTGVRAHDVTILELYAPTHHKDVRDALAARYNVPVHGPEHPWFVREFNQRKAAAITNVLRAKYNKRVHEEAQAALRAGILPTPMPRPERYWHGRLLRDGTFQTWYNYAMAGKGTQPLSRWGEHLSYRATMRDTYLVARNEHRVDLYHGSTLLAELMPDGFILHAENYPETYHSSGGWGQGGSNYAQQWDRVAPLFRYSKPTVDEDVFGVERLHLPYGTQLMGGQTVPRPEKETKANKMQHVLQWYPTLPAYLPYQTTYVAPSSYV